MATGRPKPSPSQIILSRSRSRFQYNSSEVPEWIAIPSLPEILSESKKTENESDREVVWRDRLSFDKCAENYVKKYEHVLSKKHVEDVCRNVFRCFQPPVNYLEEYRKEFEPSKTTSSPSEVQQKKSINLFKELERASEPEDPHSVDLNQSSMNDAVSWLRKNFPDADLELLNRVSTRVMRLGQTDVSEMRREMSRVATIEIASSSSYHAAQVAMNAAHDASIASSVSETSVREAEALDRNTRNALSATREAGTYAARLVERVNESLTLAVCTRAFTVARNASVFSSVLCTNLDIEMKHINAIARAVKISKDASRNACESQNTADRAVDESVRVLKKRIQTAASVSKYASISAQQSQINASSFAKLVREHRDVSGQASWLASRAASDAFRYACEAKRVVVDLHVARAAYVAQEAAVHALSLCDDVLRFMESLEDVPDMLRELNDTCQGTRRLRKSKSQDRVDFIDSRVGIENASVRSEVLLSSDKVVSLKAVETTENMLNVGKKSMKVVQSKNQRSHILTGDDRGVNLETTPRHLDSLSKSDLDDNDTMVTSKSFPATEKNSDLLSKKESVDSSVTIQNKPDSMLEVVSRVGEDDESPEKDIVHPLENPKMSKISALSSDHKSKIASAVSKLGHALKAGKRDSLVLQSDASSRSKTEMECETQDLDSIVKVVEGVETLFEEEKSCETQAPQADKNVPQEVQKSRSFIKTRADSETDTAVIVCPHVNDVLWEPLSVGDSHFPAVFPAPKLLKVLVQIRDAGCIESDSSDGEDVYAIDDSLEDLTGGV